MSNVIDAGNEEYEIDIDKLYNDFIREIDEIRSLTPISSILSLNFSKIKISNFGANKTELNVSNTSSESRCHAFYRLVGLPVLSSSFDFYSPGFFKDLNGNKDEVEKRINLLKQMDPLFYKVSSFRENYYSQTIAPIFARQDITSSVIALSSYNIRQFSSCVRNELNPENYNLIESQGYTENFYRDPIEQDPNGTYLLDYSFGTDSDGIAITANTKDTNNLNKRYHLMQPFLVDPRIDQTTQPSSRKICVPFVENKTKTQITEDVFLKRPLIEKVIRDRFYQQENQKQAFTASKPLDVTVSFFKQFENIQENEILEKIYTGKVYNIDDQSKLIEFLSTTKSILKKLSQAKNIVKETRDTYHWIPTPDKRGPEFGSKTNEINVLDTDNLNTPADTAIAEMFSKYVLSQSISRLPNETINVNQGIFAFSSFDSVASPENKESLKSIVKTSLDQAVSIRNSECEKANKALSTIEIIMGEFSGLGLIDILVVYYSLYLVDKSALIGLIDDLAIERMSVLSFKELGTRLDIGEAYDSFANTIKNLYDIVDSLWKDVQINTG